MEPASIRFNNPGAAWGGDAIAKRWGETSTTPLHDGLGQGNKIGFFPDKVHGAAAQFDRWHSSAHYHNKRLSVAIYTWSGGNSWEQYLNFLTSRVPGLTGATVMDDAFLASPRGIEFMKAQAWHEAGRPYPMTDAEWKQAQDMVFRGKSSVPVAPTPSTPHPPSSTPAATGLWAAIRRLFGA